MPRISNLTPLTTPASDDVVPIVDSSAATTKKISRADFLKGSPLPANTVDSQSITNGSVTPDKRSGGFKVVVQSFSGTGNKEVTGAGFAPKAVLAMPVHTTDTVNSRFMLTFFDGTSGMNQRTGSRVQATSGAYTRSTSSGYITNSSFSTGAENNIFSGTITALTSDGCTVNVTANGSTDYNTFMFFFMG